MGFVVVPQIVLGVLFLAAGGSKLVQPRPTLVKNGAAWAGDFSDGTVKAIGALEVLGGIGLVLPLFTGIALFLVPIAATGLALTMAGAVVVHVRRKETVATPLVLGVLAVAVAAIHFGPYTV